MSGIYKLPKLEQHPLAIQLMPGGMDPHEFTAFCEDIEARGVLMPVWKYENRIIDGWHRYRAAEKTGCSLEIRDYTGKDPAGFITSVNVLRRKLSSLQRALVGAKLHRDHNMTQRDVCKKLGISNEVVTLVLKCMDSKNAKMIKRIETDGEFTRGMLKEELEDAGLIRAKAKDEAPPPSEPASAFSPSHLSLAGASNGLDHDTDGSDEDEEDVEEIIGKGKASSDRASKKPKASAAQLLSESFKALMADEKITFLQMIWREAGPLVTKHNIAGLGKPTKAALSKKGAKK
jgi:hypothetical protein